MSSSGSDEAKTEAGLQAARDKMRRAEAGEIAEEVFAHYYRQLASGATGMIAEDEITPLTDPPALADQHPDERAAREALSKTVIIKLNGGLGTSMGMTRAKSLLPVRQGRSFLDLIVEQVRSARRAYDIELPLVLMNSFHTRADTLAALEQYPDLAVDGLPLDFLQSQEPKLRADDLTPVEWPDDPDLEWCPPGHGDVYPSLLSSGILDSLLEKGFRYASVSNSDNLGAVPDARLAGWFAASGAPFAAEVCRRTANDRKGGHLAIRRSDGQVVLRESAQTAEEDMAYFTDETRHLFFNTNSLWWDLQAVADLLRERDGVLGLPLIRNSKTVDPSDPESPEVIQIETAMGAAIGVFEGSTAIEVGRDRFLPVKTTNELLLVRSDCYELSEDWRLVAQAEQVPTVELDKDHFKRIDDFDERFASGAPSLRAARGFTVEGDVFFGSDVTARGSVRLSAPSGRRAEVASGTLLEGDVQLPAADRDQ